eukprot:4180107-Alexandrium_andersonii.AAC.1
MQRNERAVRPAPRRALPPSSWAGGHGRVRALDGPGPADRGRRFSARHGPLRRLNLQPATCRTRPIAFGPLPSACVPGQGARGTRSASLRLPPATRSTCPAARRVACGPARGGPRRAARGPPSSTWGPPSGTRCLQRVVRGARPTRRCSRRASLYWPCPACPPRPTIRGPVP